ncbi:proteoglycan 3-like [Dermochelys coriacea]|uniref:proteoglycan 3-like n=1 Tax=Dermochelys coriacea TaxID=27794 RepID=UPI0018E8014A|nr:proteoglycan 3-like [Dermochelys coriacea]XP_038262945.1 proteoglycan 3-like [Dermochelys coriacea]
MKLFLVVALVLLGTISACQLHEGSPEQDVPAEQDEEEPGEPEPPCPTESESFRMIVPGTEAHTSRYVFVKNYQRFRKAQKLCARCYHGHLASIHSHLANALLRCIAHTHIKLGLVWIGGITCRRHRHLHSCWVDHSSWNYSNWARKNPQHVRKTCVALSTAGGHWRSVCCRARLPFICEY